MVTFTNLDSVRLPSLKFVGLRVRKIRRIWCVSCLSTTVSQLFEPQLKKVVVFTYPAAHIFCRAMLCIARLLPARGVRPSVRLSVTFVSCAKTNKDIFEIFRLLVTWTWSSPHGRDVRIFPYNLMQDIFIPSKVIDIFPKFKMAAAAILDFQFM